MMGIAGRAAETAYGKDIMHCPYTERYFFTIRTEEDPTSVPVAFSRRTEASAAVAFAQAMTCIYRNDSQNEKAVEILVNLPPLAEEECLYIKNIMDWSSILDYIGIDMPPTGLFGVREIFSNKGRQYQMECMHAGKLLGQFGPTDDKIQAALQHNKKLIQEMGRKFCLGRLNFPGQHATFPVEPEEPGDNFTFTVKSKGDLKLDPRGFEDAGLVRTAEGYCGKTLQHELSSPQVPIQVGLEADSSSLPATANPKEDDEALQKNEIVPQVADTPASPSHCLPAPQLSARASPKPEPGPKPVLGTPLTHSSSPAKPKDGVPSTVEHPNDDLDRTDCPLIQGSPMKKQKSEVQEHGLPREG